MTRDKEVLIGEKVRAARAGMTQAQAVARLEREQGFRMSTRALSQIESGIRPLRVSEAVELGRLYGVSLDQLTGGENYPSRLRARTELRALRTEIDLRLNRLEQF